MAMHSNAEREVIKQRLTAFRREEGGQAAVEFAMVAMPFFAMLFSMIELALVFTISTTLDDGLNAAAREIRTGQLQTAGGATATTFRDAVCAKMTWLEAHCQTHLSLDVRTYGQFSGATPANPVKVNGTFDPSVLTFAPGGPEDIVMVRAYYRWSLFTPFLSQSLARLNGNEAVVTSTATFRNEPYDQ